MKRKSSLLGQLVYLYWFCGMPSLALSGKPPANGRSLGGNTRPPIVYTIAGSDSGGGAGIQADLHAIHNMGCHGCSAITCLTAQNSVGVTAVHTPPTDFLQQQLDTLWDDLPPRAIKIGMLASRELVEQVGFFLKRIKESSSRKIWVVLDPVMISTSGHRLIEQEAQDAMIQHVFPYVDLITPNLYEAQALLNDRKIQSAKDVEQAARDLLELGAQAVLMKGGHIATDGSNDDQIEFAQDFLLVSSHDENVEPRLCDGHRGIWLRSPWFESEHTHGTGCTLSAATAAALALGEEERHENNEKQRVGATSSIHLVDACCLAKAYVNAGIRQGVQLGQGPGPVKQTTFPSSHESFTSIVQDAGTATTSKFRPMVKYGNDDSLPKNDDPAATVPVLGRILPIVDSVEWMERICRLKGIDDVQLRIKNVDDKKTISQMVQQCQSLCEKAGIRLWINDYWEAAIQAKCFGVHVGQEDLVRCLEQGGLQALQENEMALGISTHSYGELSVALGLKPSYISLGPVFATDSKKVGFDPQGLDTVSKWRQLIPPDMPLVAIGGIGDAETAASVGCAGAACVAVIGAITKAKDPQAAVDALNKAMIR